MSLFLDTLKDDNGAEYRYGHCYVDSDSGEEFGCGMEYAYYPDFQRLDYWHDAVGLVTSRENFSEADVVALEAEHAPHVAESYTRDQWTAALATLKDAAARVAGVDVDAWAVSMPAAPGAPAILGAHTGEGFQRIASVSSPAALRELARLYPAPAAAPDVRAFPV